MQSSTGLRLDMGAKCTLCLSRALFEKEERIGGRSVNNSQDGAFVVVP